MKFWTILALGAALLVGACGENAEVIAAREEAVKQQAADNLKQAQEKAEVTAWLVYQAKCKDRVGEKYWGPFKEYIDYRRPTWYKNGRFETVKPFIASKSDAIWSEAEKQNACVVAEADRDGVTLSLDNGATFTVTTKVRKKKSEPWEKKEKRVKEVYVRF